jgi:Predicted RNA-binding protein (contains KH domain)
MEELVKYIAENLVEHPDEVKVKSRSNGRTTTVELSVAEQDMGKVIGKQGRIAKSIRKVVKAASMKQRLNTIVEII